MKLVSAGALALLWGLPLAASLAAFIAGSLDTSAWMTLLDHPQLSMALLLSLWTGTAALILSLAFALLVTMGFYTTRWWRRLQSFAAAGLALPHLAFAIGFGFLIMPSGLLARIFAGGDAPPQWVTTQDPAGLALVASLALKETPFILAMLWSDLARGDAADLLRGQWRAARSLGHGTGSVWLRVLLPQVLPRLLWPLAVVWIYGATVVDMALVIGPTQPPPLAVIVWADLNHADAAVNARGSAGAALLTLVLAGLGGLALFAGARLGGAVKGWIAEGPSLVAMPGWPAALLSALLVMVYALTLAVLLVMSIAGRWPYPSLLPEVLRADPWLRLAEAPAPLLLSLCLALATAASAIGLAVLWLETMPRHFDRILMMSAVACLGLPAVVIAGGQYRLFLELGMTGTVTGLYLAHLTAVFAYVFIVLNGPYRGFDPRLRAVAHGLNAGAWRFWWQVKAPLLKAPLLAAAAIGFSVSMVQYVPAQLIAAGRFATLPTEAVALSSGGNRGLTAAYALALALPPAAMFLLTHRLGRPRWRPAWG